jgi:hypothetical protein
VLNLLPATAATGSTVVVPGSHRRFAEIFRDEKRSIKLVTHFINMNIPPFHPLAAPFFFRCAASTPDMFLLGIIWIVKEFDVTAAK